MDKNIVFKIFKYIFLPYFISVFLAAFLGRDGANKYLGNNLLDEYLWIMTILILTDLGIYGFRKLQRR